MAIDPEFHEQMAKVGRLLEDERQRCNDDPDVVEIDEGHLARLYGATRRLVEADSSECYAADERALAAAEAALGREGPYR